MEISHIRPGLTWSDFVILRLFRRWTAARVLGDLALPSLVELAEELGTTPQAAIAVHSAFQLAESCLGRPLQGECCCSKQLAPDERAMLALLGTSLPSSAGMATAEVPHGLPGALWWAIRSAQVELGVPLQANGAAPARRCPFTPASRGWPPSRQGGRELGSVVPQRGQLPLPV